jgi:hypothetical protein
MTFTWKILELFANNDKLLSVRYLLCGSDEINTVENEGKHEFLNGTAIISLSEIKQSDVISWIEKDLTLDGINPLKLNIENQLNQLKNLKQIELPWLTNTFTPES